MGMLIEIAKAAAPGVAGGAGTALLAMLTVRRKDKRDFTQQINERVGLLLRGLQHEIDRLETAYAALLARYNELFKKHEECEVKTDKLKAELDRYLASTDIAEYESLARFENGRMVDGPEKRKLPRRSTPGSGAGHSPSESDGEL